jgi:hypothetical protein
MDGFTLFQLSWFANKNVVIGCEINGVNITNPFQIIIRMHLPLQRS